MPKLYFAGHETFYCRHFWLKKGYDFVKSEQNFNSPNAVVELGVGKNMVNSIRFWLKAFGLIEENRKDRTVIVLPIADQLFDDNGFDPYCEDVGTLWLMHYQLVNTKRASIYNIIFNDFRYEYIEFTTFHLVNYIRKICAREEFAFNINTTNRDISVFQRNYLPPRKYKSIEDDFSGLLHDLNLVERLNKTSNKGQNWYKIESANRVEIPPLIILYTILNNPTFGDTILFDDIFNYVGSIFALNRDGLFQKIQAICQIYPNFVYSDNAGIRSLQLNNKPSLTEVLEKYYAND